MVSSILLFYILAGLLVLSSLMVVFVRNVVHCALALVAALLLIAVLFVSLYAPMVGILQVLVYAGAIMVLFLFVIMFLNPTTLERRRIIWGLGSTILATALALTLLPMVMASRSAEKIKLIDGFGSPKALAESLFTDFVLPFEIASVLLLVAIVGAVVLAKRER